MKPVPMYDIYHRVIYVYKIVKKMPNVFKASKYNQLFLNKKTKLQRKHDHLLLCLSIYLWTSGTILELSLGKKPLY